MASTSHCFSNSSVVSFGPSSDIPIAQMKEAGIEVVELTPEQLDAYRQQVTAVEYPYMEQIIGAEVVGQIKAAAGGN